VFTHGLKAAYGCARVPELAAARRPMQGITPFTNSIGRRKAAALASEGLQQG